MKRKKQSSKSATGRYVLINGLANYFCKSKAQRARLIKRLKEEGKIKENIELREI